MSVCSSVLAGVSAFIGSNRPLHSREHILPTCANQSAEASTAFLRPLLSVIAILLLAEGRSDSRPDGACCSMRNGRELSPWCAFLALFNIPFGTAFGVYTMWVLLPSESEREYEALAEARAA
jgi:hypothetical protein